jgi:LuxR family maltose regulon positive regulatory protein
VSLTAELPQITAQPEWNALEPGRDGVPDLPAGTVPRPQLNQALTAATGAAITLVQGPAGAGKTTSVAAWARTRTTVETVIWLPGDASAHDAHHLWGRLRSSLIAAGVESLPPLPQVGCPDAAWSDWISDLINALADRDHSCLIVLDGFPAGPANQLGDQVVELASQAGHRLHLIMTASANPAIDLAKLPAGRSYVRLGPEQLTMSEREVAAVLSAAGVQRPQPATVSTVRSHTFGWARGVTLAAHLLAAPTADQRLGPDNHRLGAAMQDLDRALDAILDQEVLAALPPTARELVIRTSVAEEVPPSLASAMLERHQSAATVLDCRGFVDQSLDGSFRCHPLLRRAALRRLTTDWPALADSARRTAAEWSLTRGRDSEAFALATQVVDPRWLADLIVRTLTVPSILTSVDDLDLHSALWVQTAREEPLIAAAAAAARGDLNCAEASLDIAELGTADLAADDPIRRFSTSVIRLSIARQRADADRGLALVETCLSDLTDIGPTERSAELSALLDLHRAIFLTCRGDEKAALTALAGADNATQDRMGELVSVADQVGLSACLHALQGDLTLADRQATSVLTARTADRDESGVGYAQLAASWVHLERRELDQAAQRLGHAMHLDLRRRDPWLITARALTEARLATASGDPDMALRLLAAVPHPISTTSDALMTDRLIVAQAEAHIAAGDHHLALASLTPEPRRLTVEARVLAATARGAIGDRRGANAMLSAVEGHVAAAPLPAAVQAWMLTAQAAAAGGHPAGARALVERALRAADRETLRLALSTAGPWLWAFLDRNPEIMRRHRGLIDSIQRPRQAAKPNKMEQTHADTEVREPLTEREQQVLERLAQLGTTDEIAAEMYLSPNTVKTHIKNLFLKLAVNRRSEAVRQGRRLGLC